jgi:hypothetical protein
MTPEIFAGIIETVMLTYLSLGFVFSIAFLTIGITKIDHAVKGSTWGFRLIIFPGVIVLWPVLLLKWINSSNA